MCGLAGIINTEQSKFDKKTFEILGVLNDERGGDSCGIFIDKFCKKGIDEIATFRNFTHTVPYPEEATIALLHDRATSKGLVTNMEQCQPVVINDEFVLLHNGTISNYQELAKKYIPTVDTKGMSDSQVMANIFYNNENGYDALFDYTGSAVFVIVDYRTEKPTILFWGGDSIFNSTTENYPCERQLYYVQEENRFIFSSMAIGLYLTSEAKIQRLPTNVLLKLEDNNLIPIREIDRTKIVQEAKKGKTTIVNTVSNGKIWYDDKSNMYFIGTRVAKGILKVFPNGTSCEKLVKATDLHRLGFWEGKLLKKPEYYDLLNYYYNLLGNDELFYDLLWPILVYCSYEPVYDMRIKEFVKCDKDFKIVPVSEFGETYISFFPASNIVFSRTDILSIRTVKPNKVWKQFNNQDALSLKDLRTIIHRILENV